MYIYQKLMKISKKKLLKEDLIILIKLSSNLYHRNFRNSTQNLKSQGELSQMKLQILKIF